MATIRNALENERAGDQSAAMLVEQHANRTIRTHRNIPWTAVRFAKQDLLGYATLDGFNNIVRYLPARDPDDRSQICVKAEIRPRHYLGESNYSYSPAWSLMQTANRYEFADIIATYETVLYDTGSFDLTTTGTQLGLQPTLYTDIFATCHRQQGYELITSRPGYFQWTYHGSGSATDLQYPFAERLPYEDIEVVLYKWPANAYPIGAIRRCLGRVNSDKVQLPKLPFNPGGLELEETLQFMGATPDWGFFPDDSLSVDIHYAFRSRNLTATKYDASQSGVPAGSHIVPDASGKQGWNVFPAPDGTALHVSRKDNTVLGPFLTTTFAELFKPKGA